MNKSMLIALAASVFVAGPLEADPTGPTTQPLNAPIPASKVEIPVLRPHERLLRIEDVAAEASPFRLALAPDFSLLNDSEKPVKLSDFAGKWVVLYFFPASDLPADCACKGHDYTRLITDFKDMGAEVIGVSTDLPAVLANRRKLYGLDLILLSDPDGSVAKRFGAWSEVIIGDRTHARPVRTTMMIGPDGRIRRHWPEIMPEGHASRVRDFLRGWKLFEYRNPDWVSQQLDAATIQ